MVGIENRIFRDVDGDDDDWESENVCSHPTCVCSIGIDQDLKENTGERDKSHQDALLNSTCDRIQPWRIVHLCTCWTCPPRKGFRRTRRPRGGSRLRSTPPSRQRWWWWLYWGGGRRWGLIIKMSSPPCSRACTGPPPRSRYTWAPISQPGKNPRSWTCWWWGWRVWWWEGGWRWWCLRQVLNLEVVAVESPTLLQSIVGHRAARLGLAGLVPERDYQISEKVLSNILGVFFNI